MQTRALALLFPYTVDVFHFQTAAVTGTVCLPPHSDFMSLINCMHLSLLQLQHKSPTSHRCNMPGQYRQLRSCISPVRSLPLAHTFATLKWTPAPPRGTEMSAEIAGHVGGHRQSWRSRGRWLQHPGQDSSPWCHTRATVPQRNLLCPGAGRLLTGERELLGTLSCYCNCFSSLQPGRRGPEGNGKSETHLEQAVEPSLSTHFAPGNCWATSGSQFGHSWGTRQWGAFPTGRTSTNCANGLWAARDGELGQHAQDLLLQHFPGMSCQAFWYRWRTFTSNLLCSGRIVSEEARSWVCLFWEWQY